MNYWQIERKSKGHFIIPNDWKGLCSYIVGLVSEMFVSTNQTVLSSPFVRSPSSISSSVNHTPYSPGKKTRSRTIINHGLVVSATCRHSHLKRNEPWLPIYVYQ